MVRGRSTLKTGGRKYKFKGTRKAARTHIQTGGFGSGWLPSIGSWLFPKGRKRR